ncbi:MAG: energy-coupling factor transporter transmembrane protein EcfT [Oscillospiraceae bacterium]|nr:energy-coupling factor transporter transmembrane protein EcfT [Oscillospiraceae bacterium]
MKAKLFDYVERDNFIFRLSGLTKLVSFLCLTFAVMFSYDIRCILFVLVFSVVMFRMSGLKFSQIKIMLIYVAFFLLSNFLLTFIFSPLEGVKIYGTRHDLFTIFGNYVITQEQLLFQFTKLLKYSSVVPLGMIFLLTTHPSEFAASISRVGVSYKAAYAVSLTLRYFPDLIRDYNDISLAQQSRGLDFSKKEKFFTRCKNIMSVCVPLIFSTLDRIELISNAMDLRSFGKYKKRTWYSTKPLTAADKSAMLLCAAIFLTTLGVSVFINHSRYFNPFI